MKSILVLEGGALRGIYTAGVLDFLLDNDINVDCVVGVSAGALFGLNYVTKQRGRCLKYNLEYCDNKKYMGFYSLLTTGNIMNKETCFKEIVYDTYPIDFDTFKKNKTKFYAVVTNLDTGEAEYKLIKDLEKDMEYLRASGSMPCVSKIVEINNNKYLDGAIGDSIPVKWAIDEGYDKIIVVSTRCSDYKKKRSIELPYKILYHKYPKFLDNAINRYKKYNETQELIAELEKDNRIFVIRPTRFVNIKRLEKNRRIIQEMYDLGVSDTKDKFNYLKKFLGDK